MNVNKSLFFRISGTCLLLAGFFSGCRSSDAPKYPIATPPPQQQVTVTSSNPAAQGLDLQAVGALVRQARDGQDFERLLNQPGGVNNLDLNSDGTVDYLNVTEYQGGGTKNFSITDDLGGGNVQEIADIRIEQSGDRAVVQVQGNQTMYGPNHLYTANFSLAEALFLAWVFSPRPVVYASPYHFGYYPAWYRVYAPVPVATYRTTTRTISRTTNITRVNQPAIRSTAVSPNAGRTSSAFRAPLPSGTTQRQFQTRPDNRPVASGGFGQNQALQRNQPPPPRPTVPPSAPPAYRPTPPPAYRPTPPPPRPSSPPPSRNFNTRGRRN